MRFSPVYKYFKFRAFRIRNEGFIGKNRDGAICLQFSETPSVETTCQIRNNYQVQKWYGHALSASKV